MTIQVYSSRRQRGVDPADVEHVMSDMEQHMVNVNIAASVFKHLLPILLSGGFYKQAAELVKRHLRQVTFSAIRSGNTFYRKTVVIRLSDVYHWGQPEPESMWYEWEARVAM
jgi:hypothetical protein